MRNSVILLALILSVSCRQRPTEIVQSRNLFNKINLSGWHADVPDLDTDTTLQTPFLVRDSLLVSLGVPNGHLITDSAYENYELDVEYRFVNEPGNCGVLVHASTPRSLYQMFPKSLEVQMMHENAGDFWCIVENIETNDMEQRRGAKENWGITEGKERRIKNLTDGTENSLGEWNQMKIRCQNDSITVWLNHVLVNQGWNCTARKGQIAIQAEGAEVEFRKITLTDIANKP